MTAAANIAQICMFFIINEYPAQLSENPAVHVAQKYLVYSPSARLQLKGNPKIFHRDSKSPN